MQAKADAVKAQEDAALLKRQLLQQHMPIQTLPGDPFNMGSWLAKRFERTKSGRSSSGSNSRRGARGYPTGTPLQS